MTSLAQIALPLPLFRTFSYIIPPALLEKVQIGSAVEVDFHHRVMIGWVVEWGGEQIQGLKEIRDIVPFPPVSPHLLKFSERLSLLYLVPLGEVLASFFPPLGRSHKKYLKFRVFEGDDALVFRERFGSLPPQGMNLLLFRDKFRIPEREFRRFLKDGILRLEEEQWRIEEISALPGECFFREIPGFGERKVFLREILERARREQKKVLLLFPDFYREDTYLSFLGELLPPSSLIRYDSRLNMGERLRAFQQIVDGNFEVIVGTRLAAFVLPRQDLCFSVLFDPEERGYVSDRAPHYDVGEVMEERTRYFGGRLDIVCVVPSLRVYFQWTRGKLHRGQGTLPSGNPQRIQGIVARKEWRKLSLFPPTRRAIASTVQRGGSILVWVQKTGYATALGCRECGFYYTCPSCTIALRYHRDSLLLVCPLCHFQKVPESECPSCGGIQWEEWGQGVEKVFEEVRRVFPKVPAERVDPEIGEEGWREEVTASSILVGTNALLREDILQHTDLFVVHSLDEWLSLPEIDAREHFYLHLQKILRFLPRDARVLVQGSRGSLESFQDFLKPWSLFYSASLEKRRTLLYPPFGRLVRLVVRSRNKESPLRVLSQLRALFEVRGVQVLGPFPSVRPRRERTKSAELLIKYDEEEAERVFAVCAETLPLSGVRWFFELVTS